MFNAGKYNEVAILSRAVVAPDGQGGSLTTYADEGVRLWVQVDYSSSSKNLNYGRAVNASSRSFLCRFDTVRALKVKINDKIKHRGQNFTLVSIEPINRDECLIIGTTEDVFI